MADLPILYQKIADITGPSCASGSGECAQFADRPHRCCERQYCEMARAFALAKYGVTLQETGNTELPFMGATGCTVAPHLRPICSLHVCTYSWAAKSAAPEGYQAARDEVLAEAKRQDKEPT